MIRVVLSDYGVWNTSDSQFNTDFEDVYTQQALMVKWYSVLGNHDYGFNPQAQVEYVSPNANRWVMDARYYSRRVLVSGTQYITFIFLDTNPCVSAYRADDPSGWDPCGSSYPSPSDCQFHQNVMAQSCTTQYNWLKETVATIPKGDWIIGVGHPKLALNTHTVNEVWNKKVAGFTTHQFSEDLQSLTTSFISYSGESLYSFTVKRGGGPSPPPDSGSCKEYGCEYNKYNKCQCNSYCEKYDDCCSYYKEYCGDE